MKNDAKKLFSSRLNQSLDNAGVKIRGRASAIRLHFAEKSQDLSIAAARKWLNGESFPTRDNIRVLSQWLGVKAEWLEYGNETEIIVDRKFIAIDFDQVKKRIDGLDHVRANLISEVIDSLTSNDISQTDLIMIRGLVNRFSRN